MTTTINNKHKKLNVPNLRFPEFQEEWEEYRIEDITVNISSGRCKSHSSNGKYNLYGSTGIIGKTDEACYEGNLVLVARVGANAGFLQIINEPCGITDNTLIIKPKEVDVQYIYYFLQHFNLNRLIFGSGQPLITGGMLKKVKVSLGTIQEQNKITRLLSILDERIATQNKIIEDLKKLKSAIIEKHYSQVKKRTTCIADLGEPFSVGSLAKDDLVEIGSPCVIYGELFTTYGEIISHIESYTNKTDGMILSKKGDLLFPSSTTVDAMSLIAPSVINVDGVVLGGDMFGIHINHNYNAQYLSYYFNHIAKRQLAKFAKGSTIIHLHYADIEKAKLLLPSLEEQNRMAKCLVALDKKISVEQNLLSSLTCQKSYLLQQMFI